MASESEMKTTLAAHTSVGWDRFVRTHTDVIDDAGIHLHFGTRVTPEGGVPPTADSHGKGKDDALMTFLSDAGLELPYYLEGNDTDSDSALRRATRTLVGAVNNRLKTGSEHISAQSPEYKERRDILVGGLFRSAFNILTLEDLSEEEITEMLAVQPDDGPEALHSFLRSRRGLSDIQIAHTADNLALATASNLRRANQEIAYLKENA